MTLLVFSLVPFILCTLTQGANVRIDPLVLTNQGLVRGQKATDGDYSYFLGIPYATVDTDNPFGASLAAPTFDDVFNAYDGSAHCPQTSLSDDGVLDCLRLNIFTPNQASTRNPLPVLIWIHGGGFQNGKGPTENVYSLVKHDIVLVTINYRLGAYGFMSLDTPAVPGNQGLKDQRKALEWVKSNIAAFGGNPYNVTLGGQSVGGASVDLHLYLSQEKLFQKAIIHSNVAVSEGVFAEPDRNAAITLSTYLGFNTSDNESALKFLSSTAPNLISAATVELGITFKACKELSFSGVDNFIYTDPASLTHTSIIRNIPILIGLNGKEFQERNTDDNTFSQELAKQFNFNDDELKQAWSLIKHFYFGDATITTDVQDEIDDLISDFFMNHPLERELNKLTQSTAGSIYEFIFDYVNEDSGVKHATHGTEMQYLFADETNFDDVQKLVSQRLTKLWANFIKHGNPTSETSEFLPISWEPISSSSRPYLRIGEVLTLEHRFRQQSMAFWDLLYQAYESRITSRDC